MEEATFWLVKVTAQNGGWLAEGRAHQTIHLNDVLTIPQSQAGEDARLQLHVRAISTYGKDVPQLDRGLTGALLLHGSGGEVLQDDTYLYKADC